MTLSKVLRRRNRDASRKVDPDNVGRASVKSTSFQESDTTDTQKSMESQVRDTYGKYEYPWENLVFEGGGNKGLAYCGTVRVLEEVGAMSSVKRFAGASAGAMTAALVCVGYNSYELQTFLSQDLRSMFLDHKCGYCSLFPNLIRHFGWNPGTKMLKWFKDKLTRKTGDADITFLQIYKKYHKELCIVVTNLNQSITEYCHPKTTPNMPVSTAIRMSMAIPGLFQAVKYKLNGWEDTFVDGGVLCNYPIHCYDGWWLSMKPEDSFFKKLYPLSELARLFDKSQRFGKFNEKTLGFLLYSDDEQDVMQYFLDKRNGVRPPLIKPRTKICKQRQTRIESRRITMVQYDVLLSAIEKFLAVLGDHDLDGDQMISKHELQVAYNMAKSMGFTQTDMHIIFGKFNGIDEIFEWLDEDGDGQISYQEIVHFVEMKGINMHARLLGYRRKEVDDLMDFATSLQSTLLLSAKRANISERDIERTVGINTDYISTTDFKMEPGDRELLVEQGKRAAIAYLDYYINEKKPPLRKDVIHMDHLEL